MMRRILLASLVLIPSVAVAQRGGRTQADKKTDLFDKKDDAATPKGPTLRVRDVEDQSPLKLLIDKRKDLKLSDAQVSQLKSAEDKLKEKNAPLMQAVDSLVHEMRFAAASQADQARERGRNARAGLMETLQTVNANYDASAKEALATLDAEQQAKANEMIEKQRREGEKTIRERMSSGGGDGYRP
jgi:hypothetical protein